MIEYLRDQIFTLKFLKCPECGDQPFSYFKLFWFTNTRVTHKCKHCERYLKLDHYYILELFVYFMLFAILLNLLNYFLTLKLDIIFTFAVLIISFLLMNRNKKRLFKLVG